MTRDDIRVVPDRNGVIIQYASGESLMVNNAAISGLLDQLKAHQRSLQTGKLPKKYFLVRQYQTFSQRLLVEVEDTGNEAADVCKALQKVENYDVVEIGHPEHIEVNCEVGLAIESHPMMTDDVVEALGKAKMLDRERSYLPGIDAIEPVDEQTVADLLDSTGGDTCPG